MHPCHYQLLEWTYIHAYIYAYMHILTPILVIISHLNGIVTSCNYGSLETIPVRMYVCMYVCMHV